MALAGCLTRTQVKGKPLKRRYCAVNRSSQSTSHTLLQSITVRDCMRPNREIQRLCASNQSLKTSEYPYTPMERWSLPYVTVRDRVRPHLKGSIRGFGRAE